MPTYGSRQAKWSDIARAIKARVAEVVTDPDSGATLAPEWVRVAASDDYRIDTPEDFFVVVRYYGPSPFTDAGAGRRAMPTTRLVRLYLYTRSGIDRYGDDTEALLAADAGHGDREDAVLDALTHWHPEDADGYPLTVEGLHPVDSAGGPPERKPEADAGLVRSHLDFEVKYLPRLSLPDPPA